VNDKVTYGRYPTLREVLAYYSRTDFLDFLLKTCTVRKVCLVIPEKRHWEPRWGKDRIRAKDRDSLAAFIEERIERAFPDHDPGERLPFYPSFHQSVVRWPEGQVDEDGGARDEIVESDLPAWREAFQDVFTLVSCLQDEGIPWRSKFSGSRSLHVMIPRGGQDLDPKHFGGSRAHKVPIIRMPYSLNEDTGLVSLPLTWETLPAFRPWQANLSVVKIDIEDPWLADVSGDEQERVRTFVTGAKEGPELERRVYFDPREFTDDRKRRAAALPDLARGGDASELSPGAKAWQMLRGALPVTADDITEAIELKDDDETGWLAAEAYLVHGDTPSHDTLGVLLDQHHPYIRSATMDAIVVFEDQSISYFIEQMQMNNMGAKARHLSLLAQNQRLCLKLLAEAEKVIGRSGALVHRLACVSGAATRSWGPAMDMVEEAAKEYSNEPNWDTRVRALELISQMTDHWSAHELTRDAQELAGMGSVIVDMLLLAHGTAERHWRRAFLVALSEIADIRALDVFIEALGDNYHDTSRWATRALVRIGKPAIPALEDAAASDEPRIRRYAVRCLGHLEDPGVHDTILEALQDSDDTVCRQAVIALGKLGFESDIDAIVEVARTRSHRTVGDAIEVLERMGDTGISAVDKLALADGVQAAAAAIWQKGDPRGREIILAALKDPERGGNALRALSECNVDDDMIDPLVECIPLIERWAVGDVAEALRRNGSERALQVVIDLTRSDENLHRNRAATTLGRWHDPRVPEILIGMLSDDNRKVRSKVISALVEQGENARDAIESYLASTTDTEGKSLGKTIVRCMDARRELDAGEPFTAELVGLLTRTHKQIWEMAAAIARDRASDEDIASLIEVLRTDNKPRRHCAYTLLVAIGEPAREPVTRMRDREPEGDARDWAQRVLDHLAPEPDQDDA